ncbi:MAG: ABC transporter permease [Armatimonadota bacterium]|nr:ABC transporter permease [Armatimonadota bacterium]MDR7438378.1 ABC transporter permease [Armatimonadota bacterium]MDR7563356.1 ABC transporter permease [Armatimonadota bacterium]MDR7568573.1 ABC transporter permease [Armatimonadota bacterium]MDR7602422.1 ABC transporter permease [Armatimonadota bacterium]
MGKHETLVVERRRPATGRPAAPSIRFRELNILLALAVLVAFFTWRNPTFLTASNLNIILRDMPRYTLLGVGQTLVIITGGIDLSVGSMVALTNMVAAYLMVSWNVHWLLAILAVLALSSAVGMWHGLFVTKLGVPPFIITLATLMWARGLSSVMTKGFIIALPETPYLYLGQGDLGGIPVPFVVLLGVAGVCGFLLHATVLGRHLYAVGGNLQAARAAGIHVDGVRVFAYGACGFIAGLTGIVVAARLGQGNPNVGGAYELWAIAATVIGGTSLFGGEGTILGALLGGALMAVVVNGMILIDISSYYQDMVLGGILLAAVTVDILRRRKTP